MAGMIKTSSREQRAKRPQIVKSEDAFGGTPHLAGTRHSVLQVVWWTQSGLTPEEIVEHFPPLTLDQVCAALAYAEDHPEELAEHESRHTLRSVLRRADLVYVDGRLIPRPMLKESDIPPGAEVYIWETLPEGKE